MDSDLGGFGDVVSPSKWPLVKWEIQDFFKVGPDCACTGSKETMFHNPSYRRLLVPDHYRPAFEPVADQPKKMAKHNKLNCYYGEDYGGHNYPFPHPAPPKPDAYYEDAFFNILAYYENG